LVELIWKEASVPPDFKNAQIVHIYKRKGDRACCDNHRAISSLSVVGKILERVLLNRLSKHVGQNNIIPESQCGFRAARGTTDMIFAARQIQEKCREQYQDLHMVFIDLTKAFDTVNRQGLWQVLRKIGCPETFIQIVQSFHDGMQGQVIDGGEASPLFDVTNGTKQGCVLAPLLFCIFFSVMLLVAFKDCDKGVSVRFRTDGSLFNLRRLQARTSMPSVWASCPLDETCCKSYSSGQLTWYMGASQESTRVLLQLHMFWPGQSDPNRRVHALYILSATWSVISVVDV